MLLVTWLRPLMTQIKENTYRSCFVCFFVVVDLLMIVDSYEEKEEKCMEYYWGLKFLELAKGLLTKIS